MPDVLEDLDLEKLFLDSESVPCEFKLHDERFPCAIEAVAIAHACFDTILVCQNFVDLFQHVVVKRVPTSACKGCGKPLTECVKIIPL